MSIVEGIQASKTQFNGLCDAAVLQVNSNRDAQNAIFDQQIASFGKIATDFGAAVAVAPAPVPPAQ